MSTFRVNDVQINTKQANKRSVCAAFAERLLNKEPEAGGADGDQVLDTGKLGNMHGLLETVHTAFQDHRGLILSPDAIWLAIAQGFAQHVNLNAEALRDKFVKHSGQATIVVIRDNFFKGSAKNDWPGTFNEFSDQIAKHIGKQRELVVCDFSTTTPVTKAASEIVLMDAMQSYFKYEVHTRCGIPEITLLGTSEDWHKLTGKVSCLREYGLDWWLAELLPVLNQIYVASTGNIDKNFWQSVYKYNSMSGGAAVTGWINTLFPYDNLGKKNSVIMRKTGLKVSSEGYAYDGAGLDSFPSGLSKAPFLWKYLGTDFNMEFVAGFVGATQEENGALRPSIGWAVKDSTQK